MSGYLPAWVITLITLAGSTIITTVVGLLIKHYFDKYIARKEKEAAEAKAKEEELKRLQEEKLREERKQDTLAIVRSELDPVKCSLKKIVDVTELNVEGTVTLLREEMKHSRDTYIAKGFISATEDAAWHELYTTYKKLGGNHFKEYVDAWREDIDSLPREPVKKTRSKSKSKTTD